MSEKELRDRLLKLNMTEESKMLLWLTYKKQKPSAGLNTLSHEGLVEIRSWLEEAGLAYAEHEGYNTGAPPLIEVSYDKSVADELASLGKDQSSKSHQRKGELYGFPKETVEYFPLFWDDTKANPMTGSRKSWGDEYYYVRYMLRVGHEKEDAKLGLKWAKFVRSDFPELAEQFEEEARNAKVFELNSS